MRLLCLQRTQVSFHLFELRLFRRNQLTRLFELFCLPSGVRFHPGWMCSKGRGVRLAVRFCHNHHIKRAAAAAQCHFHALVLCQLLRAVEGRRLACCGERIEHLLPVPARALSCCERLTTLLQIRGRHVRLLGHRQRCGERARILGRHRAGELLQCRLALGVYLKGLLDRLIQLEDFWQLPVLVTLVGDEYVGLREDVVRLLCALARPHVDQGLGQLGARIVQRHDRVPAVGGGGGGESRGGGLLHRHPRLHLGPEARHV
mmetsp:Transcript_35865/g.81406  ORF Transcript_35865/g.81406 Transcript_35865/m.81406 type:complete len:260 (-) Transcript_35865:397-1176(-)